MPSVQSQLSEFKVSIEVFAANSLFLEMQHYRIVLLACHASFPTYCFSGSFTNFCLTNCIWKNLISWSYISQITENTSHWNWWICFEGEMKSMVIYSLSSLLPSIHTLLQIGRPVIFGLAAKGEYGVRRVLQMLKDELELTMALSGCPSVKDITRSHVRTERDRLISML